jgi:hypothetical protein
VSYEFNNLSAGQLHYPAALRATGFIPSFPCSRNRLLLLLQINIKCVSNFAGGECKEKSPRDAVEDTWRRALSLSRILLLPRNFNCL